jgi:predicted PurR-regulated permease PerM
MANEDQINVVNRETTVEPGRAARQESARASRGSWLWVVTAGGAALALGVTLLAVVWFLQRPLAILFIALTMAAALEPLIGWLEQWLSLDEPEA